MASQKEWALNAIRDGLYMSHFASRVICCDPSERQDLTDLLKAVVTNSPHQKTKIADLADLISGSWAEGAQLEVWKQTIRDAPEHDYLLILDSRDVLAKWSEAARHKAWKFLSRVAFCAGVIVLCGVEPKSEDGFRRVDGDVPYWMPSLDSGAERSRLKVALLGD